MAHKDRHPLSGNKVSLKAFTGRCSARLALGHVTLLFFFAAFPLAGVTAAGQTSAYVPGVVASSVSPVPTTLYPLPLKNSETNLIRPTDVSLDACGNIYTIDHGYDGNAPITLIPAGGGAPTIAYTAGNSYSVTLGQDASHASLLVTAPYGTGTNLIPLNNCVAQPSQAKKVGGGNGALFYYYNPGYSAGDFAGNTYITTNGTCCVTGAYYLVQETGNVGNILLSNQPNEILSLAIDKLQNVYFITGAAVYKLPYDGTRYAAAPVPFGKYLNPVGLSVDNTGNLFVADSSAAAIYEIPAEGAAGPNLADQFTISSGISINVAVAVNARGDMYYTAAGANAVSELTLGNANFSTVALGQTVKRVLNFQFNAPATLTNIQAPGGDFTIQPPSPGTKACSTSGVYGPNATTNCQITVGFKPTAVGAGSSAVVLTYTTAGPPDANQGPTTVTATTTAYLEGVGQGALLTLDPGTPVTVNAVVTSPAGIAIDRTGNTYIADPGKNSVTEYPAGGGAGIAIAIQADVEGTPHGVTQPLAAPLGVAVDGAGDVFIADTGNNRVVEVPFLNGALSPSNSIVIASGLSSPAGIFVHTNGDLYVADTGNNTILAYPNYNGPTNAGATFGAPTKLGTGLSAPLAVTLDAPGNVYIADSGNNQIVEIPLGGGQAIVAANILNPSALTADSSGSLFVVDQGNFRVLRIPAVGGTLNPNDAAEVALGVVAPYGVAVDSQSTLYLTDKTNAAAYTIARSQTALDFGLLAIGTSSTPLPLTLESAGNVPLVFSTPYFTETGAAADFLMTSPSGACADGITLVTGATCDLVTAFSPTATGASTATIAFSSNALNTPQVTLNGTGVSPSPTTTTVALITSVPGAPFYGEPLSFTATIAPATGTASPTGIVSFVVDGTQIALLPVVNGVATLPLNSGLTGGVHTVYAVYKGDASNNGSSSAVQSITITRAPTTASIAITTVAFTNPYSIRHSNSGSCDITDTSGFRNLFPAILTDPLGLTASVKSPGVGVPSGTFTFYSDGKLLNGAPDSGTHLPTSIATVLPFPGGVFAGKMTTDADTLGDGTLLGQNNVLLGPHYITVVYSGDQNYLATTSDPVLVTVMDVGSDTPVTLPQTPVSPAPYCDANSTIKVSQPSRPRAFIVSSPTQTVTASAGSPGKAILSISSLGGWIGSIEFSCPDLPQYTTCSTNPGQVNLLPSTPGQSLLPSQVVLTVTTNVPPYVPTAQSGFFWLAGALMGALLIVARRRFKHFQGALHIAGLALVVFGGIAGLSGCGSGSGASTVVTKPGTYAVTVVMTGAQSDSGGYNEVFRADVPYKMTFNLNVK